ncbi:phosphate signaling complex protein PhoU [Dasania sp. GY-MA-18]|uniref:Phosphate-specific transport system accessory protein PhoU n=1 Tax=Dasania phycosphaerae TaxID=2950436 RepID=A0A9J6RMW5_9GAMM|nr:MULTISPECIES: phosphate signaling complex protein PhoU [Dasania]MCR8922902.1 phosphate signaling complex protein PhoU [Dasania sp. GY-MA-18]MCZ0865333.1 phosphate signaling complex protein PhoU [Dasania phycosphaerae]MCZ0869058.1 phosphate signaling complex protein PhoU [Dasania phycosphaerae]
MLDKDAHSHHISQQFNTELDAVKTHMMEMGGLVEKQVSDAVFSILNADSGMAETVKERDKLINAMEVSVDDECARILARRQPAASDLRLVIAISKAVNDLERIGDEAGKIATQALALAEAGEPSKGSVEIRMIGEHVGRMVHDALDAFARLDVDKALEVAREDKLVDAEYGTAMRSVMTYMMEDPRSISSMLNVLWSLRSLERVGDHARNIAEHVIYLVKGKNVRHVGLTELAKHVEQ